MTAVRDSRPPDQSAIVALAVAAGLFPPEESAVVDGLMAAYFAGDASGHRCLVHDEGGVAAVAYVEPVAGADRVWELLMLAVEPDGQRRGVGGVLLTALEAELTDASQRLLVVETSATAGFDGARAFYAGHGFTSSATVRDYFEDGDDLIVYTKRLDR